MMVMQEVVTDDSSSSSSFTINTKKRRTGLSSSIATGGTTTSSALMSEVMSCKVVGTATTTTLISRRRANMTTTSVGFKRKTCPADGDDDGCMGDGVEHQQSQQCLHEMTYGNLCCQCGENVGCSTYLTNNNNSGGGGQGKRISVSLDWMMCGSGGIGGAGGGAGGGGALHSNGLVVTGMSSLRSIFESDVQNILRSRKLRLVLDLDETLIHSVTIRSVEQEKKFASYQQEVHSRHAMSGTEPQYYYYTPSNNHRRHQLMLQQQQQMMKNGGNGGSIVDGGVVQDDIGLMGNWQHYQQQKLREKLSQQVCVEQLEQDCFTFVLGSRRFVVFVRPYLYQFLSQMSSSYDMYIYTNGTERYASVIHQHLAHYYRVNYIQALFTRRSSKEKHMKQLMNVLCKRSVSVILDDRTDVWIKGDRENVVKIDPYTYEGFLAKELEADESSEESADEMDVEEQDPRRIHQQQRALTDSDHEEAEEEEEEGDASQPRFSSCFSSSPYDDDSDQIVVEDEDEEFLYVAEHLTNVHAQFFAMYDRLASEQKQQQQQQQKQQGSAVMRPSSPTTTTATLADVRDVLQQKTHYKQMDMTQ